MLAIERKIKHESDVCVRARTFCEISSSVMLSFSTKVVFCPCGHKSLMEVRACARNERNEKPWSIYQIGGTIIMELAYQIVHQAQNTNILFGYFVVAYFWVHFSRVLHNKHLTSKWNKTIYLIRMYHLPGRKKTTPSNTKLSISRRSKRMKQHKLQPKRNKS